MLAVLACASLALRCRTPLRATPRARAAAIRMGPDDSQRARIDALEATLAGLAEDGYPAEMLATLTTEIEGLKAALGDTAPSGPAAAQTPESEPAPPLVKPWTPPEAATAPAAPAAGPSPPLVKPWTPPEAAAAAPSAPAAPELAPPGPPSAPAADVFAGMQAPIPLDGSPPVVKPWTPPPPEAPPPVVRPWTPPPPSEAGPAPPPADGPPRVSRMQALRSKTEPDYKPIARTSAAEDAAEAMRLRREARGSGGGAGGAGGGGGGGGSFNPFGLFENFGRSPEQQAAREAERARRADERRSEREEMAILEKEALVRQEAEKAARRAARAEASARLAAVATMEKAAGRVSIHLRIDAATVVFSGETRRAAIAAEAEALLAELPPLILAAEEKGGDAPEALAAIADARLRLEQLQQAVAERQAAIDAKAQK